MSPELPREEALSDLEKDAIGEIANISMGTAATTLSNLIGKRVEITTPRVAITTREKLQTDYPLPYVVVDVRYTEGLAGENLLIIKKEDAAIIVDLMMGGDGSNPPAELGELHLSAISEAMNQMMGSAATSMSTVFQRKVNISPPSIRVVNFAEEQLDPAIEYGSEQLVHVVFKMTIEDLVDSEMMQVIPLNFAKEMARGLLGGFEEPVTTGASGAVSSAPQGASAQVTETAKTGGSVVTVQPAQFAPFTAPSKPSEIANLDLILDVHLEFTVELGKTKKTIKEILELGPGSIVELDKLAGEPVDILVNGKQIARGEVVVIDENYGVRITEILSSTERIKSFQ